MAEDVGSSFLSEKRYAVVTGANKGIGLKICRQLASTGVEVILTARDENRGKEATEKLKKENLPVEFHQLDVANLTSVASLAQFIKTRFGKLDILVNNAGVLGAVVKNWDALINALQGELSTEQMNYEELRIQTYELAEECININYYGAKRITEAFLPLLLLSDSGRIVNVSSAAGRLQHIQNERAREVLNKVEEDLNEEKVDQILCDFLNDYKEAKLAEKGWLGLLPAYTLSKAAMNAYTRIVSKIYHPRIDINSVCPGYVKTDINSNSGVISAKEGAESPVRLALLPRGESSGLFYIRKERHPFEGDVLVFM